MSSEKSLNGQIAKALGYRVRRNNDPYNTKLPFNCWELLQPDGKVYEWFTQDGQRFAEFYTPDEAWESGPDYLHSLDAVVGELPERFIIEFRVIDNGATLATFCDPEAGTSSLWYGEAPTRKAAAANALLAYAEATRKDGAHG